MDTLYSLRKNFTIIGLTGKTGAGCSQIAQKLSSKDFIDEIKELKISETSNTDQLKLNVCINYLSNPNNWSNFKVINYNDVLLLHLIYESTLSIKNLNEAIENILKIIFQNGNSKKAHFTNRFDISEDQKLEKKIREYLNKNHDKWLDYPKNNLTCKTLKECLKNKKECIDFYNYYFNSFEEFAKDFFKIINKYDFTKSTRFIHDLAHSLRAFGTVETKESINSNVNNIYTVAETVNRIIKNWKAQNNKTKIIIDSLKNSLELMYFKEKYAAFYSVATNKPETEREEYIKSYIKLNFNNYDNTQQEFHTKQTLILSSEEYKGKDVNNGEFLNADIENCIQKSDYHIFFSNYASSKEISFHNYEIEIDDKCPINIKEKLKAELHGYSNLNLTIQLAKLVALVNRPGIITPTAFERSMQVAYNAKSNSGCISRQVGAVVTDPSYSIKAIGWNDIPRMQIPCNLRSAQDLINGLNSNHFSDFEKGLEKSDYDDKKTFKTKITEEFENIDLEKIEGRQCSFCFKTFHNAFEGKKNQVHTRSLHAEENAMMQITKYGGQGLKNGNLFTTASPCELCSKKAFQLGVKNIYYIDPYPGIAIKHILKNSKAIEERPNLIMFQGVIGRAFHKLFDPFMSHKDELNILANIKPKENKKLKVKALTKDENIQNLINKVLTNKNFRDKIKELED